MAEEKDIFAPPTEEEIEKHTDMFAPPEEEKQYSSAEALKTTPPPKAYIIHIRGFLLSYMFMIPFGFIHEFGAWMLLFLVVFFYFYTGLEIISDEIEDPFGFDMNDLPVEPITTDIENRIDAISKT